MTNHERIKRKVVLVLEREIIQEKSSVVPRRPILFILTFVGWIGVLVSFLESLETHWPVYVISLSGIVGGMSLISAAFVRQSQLQWPIIKDLFNRDAISEAAKKYKP